MILILSYLHSKEISFMLYNFSLTASKVILYQSVKIEIEKKQPISISISKMLKAL